MAEVHSFVWLSNIPLYVYTASSLSFCLLMGTWAASMSYLQLIMLLWTLGYMYLFELVFSFFLDIYWGLELLDHMVVLFLIFWGTSILSSIVMVSFTFPLTVYKGSLFSTSSITLVIYYVFYYKHSNRCDVVVHCEFYLPIPDDK